MLLREEDIGWVTPPEDPTALARIIAAAASDAATTTGKGRRAVVVASRYTRQIARATYRKLMDGLLQRQTVRDPKGLHEVA
jgi:glycosyltransferase involved in cell wall biosynthesis